MQNKRNSRRDFLKASAATGIAGAMALGGSSDPAKAFEPAAGFLSPNEQPGIAFVGTGIRFHTYHGPQAMKFGPCIGVCDVDAVQAGRALQVAVDVHRANGRPLAIDVVEDYRRLLDNDDVDVVVVGTVDHWHTKVVIDALKAGKHVYCEKPVTLTIREGQQILEAHAKYGGTLQVGTQQRTEFGGRFARAAAMALDNRVGEIDQVHICLGGSRVCDPIPEAMPPRHLNWDMWLGQCPVVPYRSNTEVVDVEGWGAGFPFSRTHRYYRWFYEYSGGKLTDWGAHHLDIALLGMNKLGGDIGPVQIEPVNVVHPVEFDEKGMPLVDDRFNCASEYFVKCTFADGVVMNVRHRADDLGFDNGIMFTGKDRRRFLVNRGKLVGRPVEDLEQQPLPEDAISSLFVDDPTTLEGFGGGGFHMANFIDCIKTGRTPASDMQSHHRMLNICHAINIAMRLNRTVVYDPSTETFGDDELANTFIEREQRAGYEIEV